MADPAYLTVLVFDALALADGSGRVTFRKPDDGPASQAVVLSQTRTFKIAVSFPGEVRSFVEPIVRQLQKQLGKEAGFYDIDHQAELASPDLDQKPMQVYRDNSELVVVLIGPGCSEKQWCGLEWHSIRELLKTGRGTDVMLLRMKNAKLPPGMLSIDGFANISNHTESLPRANHPADPDQSNGWDRRSGGGPDPPQRISCYRGRMGAKLREETVDAMSATPDQTEGLKLISEWCKWLITVETAAVGGVAVLAKDSNGIRSSHWVRLGYGFAVASFVCSIVVAAAILSNVPTSVQDMKPGEKIWDRWIYIVNRPICKMHLAGNLLFGLFVLGVASFASAVMALITGH